MASVLSRMIMTQLLQIFYVYLDKTSDQQLISSIEELFSGNDEINHVKDFFNVYNSREFMY